MKQQYFTLTQHPEGVPGKDSFALKSAQLAELADGEVRVRNSYLSVDPYMRGRMNGVKTYIEPFELGRPMDGAAVGEVIASKAEALPEGTKVLHNQGWRDLAQGPATDFKALPDALPERYFLGVLGMPGMTAWTGLNKIAGLKQGDKVLVTAASGAVGSLACQLAVAKGCHVVGTAGSDDKVQWLESLGVAGINYKAEGDLYEALRHKTPDGIDVIFENVGGPLLAAGMNAANPFCRIALCGMIHHYNDGKVPTPDNFSQVIAKRLRVEGFLVFDHWQHYDTFLAEVMPWVQDGRIAVKETIEQGLESMPDAFAALFSGGNTGKMLVQL